MSGQPPIILYFVHDLTDNSVRKRVQMFVDGGCSVVVAGFSRATPPTAIHGSRVIFLGKSYDGKFIHRIVVVFKIILFNREYREFIRDADAIVARTLEMLAIAVRLRSFAMKSIPLVYESLDIHRFLLNEGLIGKIFRGLEAWLLKRCKLILTSSPAFIREYFMEKQLSPCPTYLIENKVYEPDPIVTTPKVRPFSPPWKIGWFGAIRCNNSLRILSNLAVTMNGQVEIIIRGKVSYDQFADFDAQVSGVPHLRFLGAYKNPDDLETIYNEIHFTWAIDMFEKGLNSSWLLPNRIYEGGRYGSVPLAQSHVETGRYLSSLGIGVQLEDPLEQNLVAFFSTLKPEAYQDLQQRSLSLPTSTWVMGRDEACKLTQTILNSGNQR